MTATDRKAFRSVLEARERAEVRREREMREYANMLSTKYRMELVGLRCWPFNDERFEELDAKFGVGHES